nr:cysteine-rich repeat secretory protein 38 [Quercus suber]
MDQLELPTLSYNSSLTALFESLSSKASQNNSFYNDSSNIGIYSLYLCRGDVSNESCKSCVSSATQEIINRCPSSTEAIIWYDECTLRYADVNFFGKPDTRPWLIMNNVENTTSPGQPNFYARGLLDQLIGRVNEKDRLFETDEQIVKIGDESLPSYGLVQCTRDLDVGGGGKKTTKIIIITISSIASIADCSSCSSLRFLVLFILWQEETRTRDRETGQKIPLRNNLARSLSMHLMDNSMHARDDDDSGEMHYFDLTTILTATNNFSDVNKLGEGGFGPVYKIQTNVRI